MNSRSRELKEFYDVPVFGRLGSTYIEKLYERSGLIPSLEEFIKQSHLQLQEILKPRPFVKPLVKRRVRRLTVQTKSLHVCDYAAQSLPTPPYEPDPPSVPSPSVQSPALPYEIPALCEDLEGIADVAPEETEPAPTAPDPLPTGPGPKASERPLQAPERVRPTSSKPSKATSKPKRSWRKLTARKSTLPKQNVQPINCSIPLVNLISCVPSLTKPLLKEYFAYEKRKDSKRRYSTDSGHVTDEPDDRTIPPIKIRLTTSRNPSVHEVLGKIAIGPSSVTADRCKPAQTVAAVYTERACPSLDAPAQPASPSVIPQQNEPPTEERSSLNVACATVEPGTVQERLQNQPASSNFRAAQSDAIAQIQDETLPKPPTIGPSTEIDTGKKPDLEKPRLKGILKNQVITNENPKRKYLSDVSPGKPSAIKLPRDVVPTLEFNVDSRQLVTLSLVNHRRREVQIGTIENYPILCIVCSRMFPSRRELASHELTSNHSSSFAY